MKNKKGVVLFSMGLLLVAAALSLTGYNLYDEYRASRTVHRTLEQIEAVCPVPSDRAGASASGLAQDMGEVEIPDYLLNPDMDMPVQHIDGQDYVGVLRIPALGLELPVLGEWSYPRLKLAPCRYDGSAYLGNLIIAAHNYPSHFGTLKNLLEGDAVTFTDTDGNVFDYEVVYLETLEPGAVEEIKSGGWALTLFTCTVGGSYRVTVRCQSVDA